MKTFFKIYALSFFLVMGFTISCKDSTNTERPEDVTKQKKKISEMKYINKIPKPDFGHMEGTLYKDLSHHESYSRSELNDNFEKADSRPVREFNEIKQTQGHKCYLSNKDLNIKGLKRCDTNFYKITPFEKSGLDLKINHCKTGKEHNIDFKYYFSLQDMTKLKRYKTETKVDQNDEKFKRKINYSYYKAEKRISQFLGIIFTNPVPMRNVSLALDDRIAYCPVKKGYEEKTSVIDSGRYKKVMFNVKHKGHYRGVDIIKYGQISSYCRDIDKVDKVDFFSYQTDRYDIYKNGKKIKEVLSKFDGGSTFFIPLVDFDSNGIFYMLFLSSDAISYHFDFYFIYNGEAYFVPVYDLCGHSEMSTVR